MIDRKKKVHARFFMTASGNKPVREWLFDMRDEDRRAIGYDIQTVEFGWPIGMPTCRSLGDGLWEVRSDLSDRRIGRTIFFLAGSEMILLHGFIKKTKKTPKADIEMAAKRRKEFEI